ATTRKNNKKPRVGKSILSAYRVRPGKELISSKRIFTVRDERWRIASTDWLSDRQVEDGDCRLHGAREAAKHKPAIGFASPIGADQYLHSGGGVCGTRGVAQCEDSAGCAVPGAGLDRKSTRLNSSHVAISYAVFCLKKKKKKET